jgi:serine/threonine-protein kinase
MLVGHHPFKAEDARGLLMMQATRPVPPVTDERPDLAARPALVAAVARACDKDPVARQQTAAELRDELAASLGSAFLMPPGATPAPAISLDGLSPVQLRELLRKRPERWTWAGTRSQALALILRTREWLRVAWRRSLVHVRAHRRAWTGGAAAALLLAVVIALLAWRHGRAAAQARELLASDRPGEARAVLEEALEHRAADPELLLLLARALHRGGQRAEAIEAYAAARARRPLDETAYEDLVADLGLERSVADRATRLLREEGTRAVPAVVRAASGASGAQRLRALTLARDLGAEDQVDRVAAYVGLLADTDCELRRAAARRLGELGDPSALPPLRKASGAKVEAKGFFGKSKITPACGAADADAAARRIEAARLTPR